jgi:hypothetical protein
MDGGSGNDFIIVVEDQGVVNDRVDGGSGSSDECITHVEDNAVNCEI